MTLLGRTVAVAFPDTVLEEKESPRDKSVKLGQIARACSIYGVDRVEVFPGGQGGDWNTIRKILEYLETPQYLRKRLFPLDETLKFAGILPPLRIPSHKSRVESGNVRPGEFREGVSNGDGTVDVGLVEPATVKEAIPAGRRVTVRLSSGSPLRGTIARPEETGEYWGFKVLRRSPEELFSDDGFTTIATSKLGEPLAKALPDLRRGVVGSKSVRLVFGSPSKGLFDLMGEGLRKKADFVVNLFPEQEVETVRSEEAMFVGLAVLSMLLI